MLLDDQATCPCGTGGVYGSCCGPIHADGAGLGTTAEQLMRARYSAYALKDGPFLLTSWHPDHRPDSVSFPDEQRWLGLTIVDTTGGGGLQTEGTVEFKATFTRGEQHFELHELSSFRREGGKWLYVDGFNPG